MLTPDFNSYGKFLLLSVEHKAIRSPRRERLAMRIRRDSVFISSVLFTIALLCLIPPCLANAMTGRSRTALQELDAGFRAAAQLMGELGIVSLAIIFIGLIVTWTGFIKGVRWTWFVMCIIVWAWAFPLLILPFLGHTIVSRLQRIH